MKQTNSSLQVTRNGSISIALAMFLCAILPVTSKSETAFKSYKSGSNVSQLRQLDSKLNSSITDPEQMEKVESTLIQLLASDSTFEAKRFACTRLAVCGTETSVDALAELLKEESTVGIACLALGSISSEKAGDALREALAAGPKGPPQLQIITTLGSRAEPSSTALMVKLAHNEDITTAVTAICALGAIGDPAAREALAVMRREKNAAIDNAVARASLHAAQHLTKAGDHKEAQKICEVLLNSSTTANLRRGAFSLLLQCQHDGGADLIAELLERSPVDPLLAAIAINHVPELEGWFVSRRFSKLLDTLAPDQKVLMIHALACRNEASTRKAVRRQLDATDNRVRMAAVAAIGRTEDENAVPLLVNALSRNTSAEDSQALETALAEMKGGEKTDQALCSALKTTEALILKKALLGALSRRGGSIAAQTLVNAACESDENLSKAAVQSLTLLAGSGNTASLNAIQDLLKQGDMRQRKIALKTLSAWRGTDAWQTLADVYLNSRQEEENALALRGLIRMLDGCNAAPDKSLFARYGHLLDGAHSDADRKKILSVLAGVRHPDALNLVYPLLDEPALRDEAAAAIKRIAGAIQKSHPDIAKAALNKIS